MVIDLRALRALRAVGYGAKCSVLRTKAASTDTGLPSIQFFDSYLYTSRITIPIRSSVQSSPLRHACYHPPIKGSARDKPTGTFGSVAKHDLDLPQRASWTQGSAQIEIRVPELQTQETQGKHQVYY